MLPQTKNRKAISTVLTTLIILVASVVLGTGVVLYGTSLFKTGAQSTSLDVTGVQVWADKGGSGWAWGAADVRNSGDKLLSVDTISVRGNAVPFSNWYANNTSSKITSSQFQSALVYTRLITPSNGILDNNTNYGTFVGNAAAWTLSSCTPTTTTMVILLGTAPTCLSQQSGPVSLAPGEKAIIYFKVPQNILTTVDAGASSSVAIYAGQVGAPQTVTVASK